MKILTLIKNILKDFTKFVWELYKVFSVAIITGVIVAVTLGGGSFTLDKDTYQYKGLLKLMANDSTKVNTVDSLIIKTDSTQKYYKLDSINNKIKLN